MSSCTRWADENICFRYAKISELDISMRPYPTMNVGQEELVLIAGIGKLKKKNLNGEEHSL